MKKPISARLVVAQLFSLFPDIFHEDYLEEEVDEKEAEEAESEDAGNVAGKAISILLGNVLKRIIVLCPLLSDLENTVKLLLKTAVTNDQPGTTDYLSRHVRSHLQKTYCN